LHEGVKGVDVCAHFRNWEARAKFDKEHNDVHKLKEQRSNIGSNTRLVASSEPRIVHEARKRMDAQFEEETSKSPAVGKDGRLARMLNNQGREEAETSGKNHLCL
jgi:hypothetical protein